MRLSLSSVGAVVAGPFIATAAFAAPISFTGSYSENFDSMGATGTTPPAGWAGGTLGGAWNNTTNGDSGTLPPQLTIPATDGSTNETQARNLGSSGSSDRAFGTLASTSNNRAVQLELTNNTGAAITSFVLTYTGEQWRQAGEGGSTEPSINFEGYVLKIGRLPDSFVNMGSAFDFTPPVPARTDTGAGGTTVPLDGNAAANRVTNIGGNYNLSIPWNVGETIYLRWFDVDNRRSAGNSLSDAVIAVDDVSIVVPEPASLALLALGGFAVAGRRRV